ncbi:MAG: MarR family transcriptional regulator [Pseudomonadota bacterium]
MRKKVVPQLVPPIAPNSQARRLNDVLPFQLRRAQEASFSAFARRVDDSHIWPGWYSILVVIHDNPGITPTALSSAIGRDKSTLTASLRELRRLDMTKRTQDPADGRSFHLSLTELGKQHLKELRSHARLHERLVDEIVGNEKRDALVEILRNLADELNKR